jgi:hypothetical protein
MAAYVHKTWNAVPCVIPEGVAIKFSTNRFYLYVFDAEGAEIAKFRSQSVRNYWVESPDSAAEPTCEESRLASQELAGPID